MVTLKFRVSGKLAIGSSIGLLLIAAMLANGHVNNDAVATAYAAALRQQDVVKNAAAGITAIRNAEVAQRGLRLALSPEQVAGDLDRLRQAAADGRALMEAARRLVDDSASQQRMDRIAGLFDQYAARSAELASFKADVLKAQAKQNDAGDRWTSGWDSMEVALAIAKVESRNELDSNLREGAQLFMDARNTYWRFINSGDPKLAQGMVQRLLGAAAALRQARSGVTDKDVVSASDELLGAVAAYKEAADVGVKAWINLGKVYQTVLLPLGDQIDELLPQIAASAERTAEIGVTNAATQMTNSARIGLAVGLVAFVILIGTAVFGAFSIAKPIQRLTAGMKELAGGNFDVVLPGLGRKDEIGEMAHAVEMFKVKTEEKARLDAEERQARDRAAAEQKRIADEHEASERSAAAERQDMASKEAMHRVVKEFKSAVGGIIDLVSSSATELEATASTLANAAGATQQLSNAVSAASGEASSNVQTVASATEHLTASVHEISKQVEASRRIADQAVSQAEKTDARITTLSQAASRIGDVVKLITSVAEQTNLLALNATIEAARAGEAGRGFAIVAQEVKALAAQTAKATEEIGTQICGMQAATQESVVAIKEISSTIGQISEISGVIAAAVEEQGAATHEIARNVEAAAKGTGQVSANIADVNSHASETGTASAQMLSSAQSLSGESNHLKAEMANFLDMVRTGLGNRRKADDPGFAGPERRKDKLQPPAGSQASAA